MRVRDPQHFAAFILTHGRAANQITTKVLRREGYTGRIVYVVDDQDKDLPRYQELYGTDVVVFSKADVEGTFDVADTTDDMRAVVYARNASWGIAESLGLTRFVQLDDDYYQWLHRYRRDDGKSGHVHVRNLDAVFEAMMQLQDDTGAAIVAVSQGGDHIGGVGPGKYIDAGLKRKVMNTMWCRTDTPVEFPGRINEDVNAYVTHGSRGVLFLSAMSFQVNQTMTQQATGGLTDIYLASGTYVKSFYTVMMAPSCTKISVMGETGHRFHHHVTWDRAVPKILSSRHRKPR